MFPTHRFVRALPLLALILCWSGALASEKAPVKDETEDTRGLPPPAKPRSKAANELMEKVRCEQMPQKSEQDLWDRSQCYFQLGDHMSAAEGLREITKRNPRDLEAYFTSSWLLWSYGKISGGSEEEKATKNALDELQRARLANPFHWEVDVEIGDFYFLRLNQPEKAYVEYLNARKHYEGEPTKNVPKAENGRKAAIENRIARTAEKLDRRGEAIEASCFGTAPAEQPHP
jgi:tetratricopeptide (TPR) repeat protein